MPQIDLIGTGAGGEGEMSSTTSTDGAVLAELRGIGASVRDLKESLMGRASAGTQLWRSGGSAEEHRTRQDIFGAGAAGDRAAERLKAASALPIDPAAARAMGVGVRGAVAMARSRDRADAAAARVERQDEVAARSAESARWATLKSSAAGLRTLGEIRAASERPILPDAAAVLKASARDTVAATLLRSKSEVGAEKAQWREIRDSTKAWRTIDRLKKDTLDQEARNLRAAAERENRNFDIRRRLDDRRYRDMRVEAADENRERDAKDRFANRAYSAMRRAADADNREHDRKQRFHERQVARSEKERKAAEKVERAGWRKRVEKAGLGRFVRDDESNLGTIARLAPLGRLGGFVGMAAMKLAEGAEAAIESPRILSSVMDKFVSGAGPYRDLVYGASDLGRAGGFDGQRTVDDWLPGGGRDRTWRRIRGLRAADLPGIVGAYGVSATSADAVKGIVSASADANYAPYLGGLGRERYAAALGLAQTLGIKGDGGFGQGADPGLGGKASGAYQYFRDLQRVMTAATSAGLDHSQVMSGLESYMRQSASSGAAEINAPKSVEAWWKMASSGSAAARTGEEQASALAGMTDQVNSGGLGGGVTANAVFQQYFSRHGGMPKSAGGWAKLLGVDPTTMQPGEKRKFDDLVAQSQTGNAALTFEYAKPFLKDGGASVWRSMVDGSGLVPQGPTHDLVAARLTGMTTDQYIDLRAGSTAGLKTPTGGLGWGEVPDDVRAATIKAAGMTGVDKATLAGLFSYESGFRNSAKSGTGAVGLGQITRTAILDLEGGNKTAADYLWRRSQTDPTLNATLSGQYYATLRARYGSDREALRHYHGLQVDKNGVGPDQYADGVTARIAAFRNDPSTLDEGRADQGDMQVGAAKQSELYVEAMSKAAPLIIKWSDNVTGATDAVAKFTEQLLESAGKFAAAHLSPPSGAGAHRYLHQAGAALQARGPLMP